jgi:tRNA threonylcarbamoyladenosine biosynthesis protein TsaB
MRLLAIDTSTLLGSVALSDNGRLIAEEQLGVEVTHSERLLSTITHLLDAVKWSMEEIDGVAVSIGPGSFTGLRIGMATAKGIALGLEKPIVGVSSLLVLAFNGISFHANVVPVIDARRGEVYASAYRFKKSEVSRKRPESVMDETAIDPLLLCEKLKKMKGDLLLVGDGTITYEKEFKRRLKGRALFGTWEMRYPHASHLCELAFEKLSRGKGDDIAGLAPNYIRRTDAEIGFKGRS